MLLLSLFVFIFAFSLIIVIKKSIKKTREQDKELFRIREKKLLKELEQVEREIQERKQVAEKEQLKIEMLDQAITMKQARLEDTIRHEAEMIKSKVEAIHLVEMQRVEHAVQQERERLLENLKEEHEEVLCEMLNERLELDELIAPLRDELHNYKLKRDAINAAILRERAVEQEKDFHRIVLTEDDKNDIEFLLSIECKLKNKELLRKLIWSEFLQRPTKDLINRVSGGKPIKNVVYCLTYIPTGEKYIGKTVELSNRWTEHVKTSLSIGKVAKTKIHEKLYKNWDEFIFEILEEDISDLASREKYYISFYNSDKFGFNMKVG
jgi:hypothetical protein